MSGSLARVITQEEFEKLFAEAKKVKWVSVSRRRYYRTAMLLGFEAGMRISEVIGLKEMKSKCCKAEIEVGRLRRKKIKTCSECKKVLQVTDLYIDLKGDWEVPPLMPDKVDTKANSIFISNGKGKKDRIVPLPKRFTEVARKMLPLNIKRRSLQHFITKLGKEVLNKRISFHTLRHSIASILSTRIPLPQLQQFLGHARLDTTSLYIHLNPKEMLNNVRNIL